jgi:hypothetical protein
MYKLLQAPAKVSRGNFLTNLTNFYAKAEALEHQE